MNNLALMEEAELKKLTQLVDKPEKD
jgi:hypothetical protein